jgi:hypothetical protein
VSIEVTTATFNRLRELPELLQSVPERRRPSVQNCALVALLLADRMRDRKGYVDETVDQILDVLPLSKATVTNCLYALDMIGWWTRQAKGNHRAGTRRTPAVLTEHGEADLTMQHDGADPTQPDGEHREVGDAASLGSTPSIVRYGTQHREADLTTPHHPHPVTPTTSSSQRTSEQELDRAIPPRRRTPRSIRSCQIDNPTAPSLMSQFPNVRCVASQTHAIEFGDDPLDALEVVYPTRPTG